MSARLDYSMLLESARPTRRGTRRRPPLRDGESVRPSAVYRRALEESFAKMSVIERLREDGFSDPTT
jgi:hypothetical protein